MANPRENSVANVYTTADFALSDNLFFFILLWFSRLSYQAFLHTILLTTPV